MDLFRKLRDALKKGSAEATTTPADQARVLLQRGDDQLALHHPLQAIDFYHQANQIFTQLADQFHQASTLGRLGNAYSAMGNREQAIKHYQAALDRSQAIPDLQIACAALGNLGLLAQYADQPEQALNYFFQARDYARTLQDTSVMRFTLNNIANTFFEQGQYEQAIAYCEQFIEANKTTDNRRDDAVCFSKMGLAYVHLQQGERGRSLLRQALDLLQHSTNPEARSDLERVKALLAQLDRNGN
jgi:tetratricopeptide (TPR) repeat protein